MLDKIYLSIGRADERLWTPNVKGQFSVKSFYNVMSVSGRVEIWKSFWDPSIPPRVCLLLGSKEA